MMEKGETDTGVLISYRDGDSLLILVAKNAYYFPETYQGTNILKISIYLCFQLVNTDFRNKCMRDTKKKIIENFVDLKVSRRNHVENLKCQH